jgi:hypothetical protein
LEMNETKLHPICTVPADGAHLCAKFCNLCNGGPVQRSYEIPVSLDNDQEPLTQPKASSVCTDKQFNCSAYSCISTDYVCDTINDCYNNEDEKNCPQDCSGPHQFRCLHDSSCISQRKHCDGHPDCIDWSDEANCAEFDCLEGYTHCVTSLECIRESYRCDGDRDCEDGSDEAGCPVNPTTCASTQFHCRTGARACITKGWVCDGDKDCMDGSDEQGCTCKSGDFSCSNGGCVTGTWKCDGDNDCGDMSDELRCPEAPANTCSDVLTAIDCMAMNTTAHPICTVPADAHKFCRKFCNMCTAPTPSG